MSEGAICDTFDQALALHRAGRVSDAESLYRQVLGMFRATMRAHCIF